MAPGTILHLPNRQTVTVSPSFGGLSFKSNDLNLHNHAFPAGWSVILNSEINDQDDQIKAVAGGDSDGLPAERHHRHIHRYKQPTLQNDHLFISSISNPSSAEFRSPSSPTRQIAMMLWATLWWYFHQPAPPTHLTTTASSQTPDSGKPRGEWRIYINREGIFKGRHLMPKLERMGLVSCEDSCVGADPEDGAGRDTGVGYQRCFVSRRAFWQIDARIYLFTMAPAASPYPTLSPSNSRPSSPSRTPPLTMTPRNQDDNLASATQQLQPFSLRASTPPGPFSSASHLPTFYPPPPLQYVFSKTGIRHPVRPKPARQGEVVYTRYIPSLGQYLSCRVASLSTRPVQTRHIGGASPESALIAPNTRESLRGAVHSSDNTIPMIQGTDSATPSTCSMTDVQLLHKWMNDPRVAASWGEQGPQSHQEAFLKSGLESRHSFPVIGMFDDRPFGYFEIYWVKEDRLSAQLSDCGDWDRGLHVLVGEQEFRGSHRVKVWLSALVHYCFLADQRTNAVYMEPRVDNEKCVILCHWIPC